MVCSKIFADLMNVNVHQTNYMIYQHFTLCVDVHALVFMCYLDISILLYKFKR